MCIINSWRDVPAGEQVAKEEASGGQNIDRRERIALFRRIRRFGCMESGPREWRRPESLAEMKTNCLGRRLPRGEAAGQKCDLTNDV